MLANKFCMWLLVLRYDDAWFSICNRAPIKIVLHLILPRTHQSMKWEHGAQIRVYKLASLVSILKEVQAYCFHNCMFFSKLDDNMECFLIILVLHPHFMWPTALKYNDMWQFFMSSRTLTFHNFQLNLSFSISLFFSQTGLLHVIYQCFERYITFWMHI